MNPIIAIAAAVVGYLIGAVSFTRIIAKRIIPDEDIEETRIEIPGADRPYVMRSVGASAILARKGPKYGLMVTALDMLKGAVPTLIARLLFPEAPYFLITGVAVIAGHNFPIYYGFKGGAGISCQWGELLTFSPLGIVATFVGSKILGRLIIRDIVVSYTSGTLLLIPWMALRFRGDPAYISYAVGINILFWASLWADLKLYVKYVRSGDIQRKVLYEQLSAGHLGSALRRSARRPPASEEADTSARPSTGQQTTKPSGTPSSVSNSSSGKEQTHD